jgi:hypothetical protein
MIRDLRHPEAVTKQELEMAHGNVTARLLRACSLLAALTALSACSSSPPDSGENVGRAQSAVFTNGQFETGAAGVSPPGWTVTPYLNNGITVQNPQTRAGLNLLTTLAGHNPPKNLTSILVSPTGALTQTDPDLGVTASLRWPRYGNQCAIVNQHSSTNFSTGVGNNGKNVNSLAQTMVTDDGDLDAADGLVHVRFVVAPVLQNPAHVPAQQPYYLVQLTNVTKSNTLLYSDFNLSGTAGIPWQKINPGAMNEIDYTDWQLVDIAPGTAKLAKGDTVTLEIIAGGCQPGGHFGEIYVDGVGTILAGLFVSGTGPVQANAGTDITYKLTYENADATPQAGVVVTFNTPPQTKFKSITAPGLTCTTPTAGNTGAVICTVGALVAKGTGSFQVTVTIDPAATGVVTAGNYFVQSPTSTPLIGPHITTAIGCALDTDCSTGNWCNIALKACTPTSANSVHVPSDASHVVPLLDGTCSMATGALTCTSAVCDTADNVCGYANNDGICIAAIAGVVCRTGACGSDNRCGYPVGEGPCSAATLAVCRSGTCSSNSKCEPSGGCNVDADCAAGKWCNEGTHVCTAQLVNGSAMPTDPTHSEVTVDGTCNAGAGILVCASGKCDVKDNKCGFANSDGPCTDGIPCRSAVCDPDGFCGYKSGDGPCTALNGNLVCRDGACSKTALVCEPTGGCAVDADCLVGDWCNETTFSCTPALPNGAAVPTDGKHMSPTLNGSCTTDAALLVCQSTVCDTRDNDCGYANGDGPCTAADAGKLCRSQTCSTHAPLCMPAGGCAVDADCAATEYCDTPSSMCVSKLPNGQSVPKVTGHTPALDGTCTVDAATITCASGACDSKDSKCGYATGDGPCDATSAATVCRSGLCSADSTCTSDTGCNVDADCKSGNWCNENAHMCLPTLANGTKVPVDAGHTQPTLDGTCTAAAGTLVCQSAACDTGDNACGYANGDGPCDATSGPAVCRSGICATAGSNANLCVACLTDAQCSGVTPKCNTATNTCIQCGTSTDCPSDDPVCNTTNGLCTTGCTLDTDCMSTQWCDAPSGSTGLCQDRIPNGDPLPSSPTEVTTCSTDVAARVCVSGVCDVTTETCGGTACTTDSDCSADDFCSGSACTPKLPTDNACDRNAECQTNDCNRNVCSAVVAQGNGLLCAVSTPGSSHGKRGNGALAMMLALAGLGIARRRPARRNARHSSARG